jgi:hypothetical protein
MTSTSRQSIATLATDLQEVLAWGAAAEAANADLTVTIAARDSTIASFEQLIAQEIDASTALRDTIAAKDADIENQRVYIVTLQTRTETLSNALSAANAEIAAKDAEIARITEESNDWENAARSEAARVNELTPLLAAANAEIARLTALLNPFTVYNEMKSTGPIPGWPDILVIYESELFPSSVTEAQRSTTPPDEAFLDAFFANLFAQHGDVRLVLDSEKWRLITDVDSPTGIDMTVVGWYVTLVSCAKNAGFTNVGLYGEITERATLYLNYPVGHDTHTLRKSNWQARNAMCQPMWDAVDTIYPSFYPIKPIHNDAAKRDAWMDDNLAICRERAPGKPVIPFLMARVHPSADETKPYLSGAYWRAWLEKVKSAGYDGLVVYQNSTDPDPLAQSPVPDWHLETEAFRAQLLAGMVGPQ